MYKKCKLFTVIILMLMAGCTTNAPIDFQEEPTEEIRVPPVITTMPFPSFEWDNAGIVSLSNLTFEYKNDKGIFLRECPTQEIMNGEYWVTGQITDADGYRLEGHGYEILIIADIIDIEFNELIFIQDYVFNMIVETGIDNVQVAPERREIGNREWAYFMTAIPNYTHDGEYIRMEQFALFLFRDELYSVHAVINDVRQEVFEEVQRILSSFNVATFQERVDEKQKKTDETVQNDFIAKFDKNMFKGIDVLNMIKSHKHIYLAIIVKNKMNSVTSVANYNTLLGIKRNERFDLTKLNIIGTPPDAEKLETSLELDKELVNWDLNEAQTKLSDDYINFTADYLSFLIYNKQGDVIGIYFEQLN